MLYLFFQLPPLPINAEPQNWPKCFLCYYPFRFCWENIYGKLLFYVNILSNLKYWGGWIDCCNGVVFTVKLYIYFILHFQCNLNKLRIFTHLQSVVRNIQTKKKNCRKLYTLFSITHTAYVHSIYIQLTNH